MIKKTENGIICTDESIGQITEQMQISADECFKAYSALNNAIERLEKIIPQGFYIHGFYGKGDCVKIYKKPEKENCRDLANRSKKNENS